MPYKKNHNLSGRHPAPHSHPNKELPKRPLKGARQTVSGYETEQWVPQAGGDGLVQPDPQPGQHYQDLQTYRFMPSTPYAEPAHFGDSTDGPYALSFLRKGKQYQDVFLPYQTGPENAEYFAPAAPIRRDPFQQGVQFTAGQAVNGTAPIGSVYTGVEDLL